MSFSDNIDSSPSPSFCKRLAAEKRVDVYFIPGTDSKGQKTYTYAVVSSVLNDKFIAAIDAGVIPDFAVVVEMGYGEPSDEIKAKMKKYYGFQHADSANDNATASGGAATAG